MEWYGQGIQGENMKADQERWDAIFAEKKFALGRRANPFLRRHVNFLPKGIALDLATGEGRNAVFLALQGLEVDAVDISKVGLSKARILAKDAGSSNSHCRRRP